MEEEYEKYRILILTRDETDLLNMILNNWNFLEYVDPDENWWEKVVRKALTDLLGEDDVINCFLKKTMTKIIIVGEEELI